MTSYVWFVRGPIHAAMCRTSIESVRRIDPDADCIVMSDDTEVPGYAASVFPTGTVDMPIMVANIEAQIQGMFRGISDKLVFLDTDIILLDAPASVADITVTWRDHVAVNDDGEKQEGIASIMPYNYGIVTANYGKATVEAFIWMRERVKQMAQRQQEWYGNQLALAELAGPAPRTGIDIASRQIPWSLHQDGTNIMVGKVPCEIYNYTPQAPDEDVSKRVALHFKGKKRDLMAGYAKKLGLGWYL